MNRASHFLMLLLIISLVSSQWLAAQEYHTIKPFSAGIRGSFDGIGVNGRLFFSDLFSVEAQLNASGGKPSGTPMSSGKSITGVALGQLNFFLYNPNLRGFIGAGFHYGSWERYKGTGVAKGVFGYDGIMGLEYAFTRMPVSVSLDFKPAFSYIGGVTYFPNNIVGIGLRYSFGEWRQKPEKLKKK